MKTPRITRHPIVHITKRDDDWKGGRQRIGRLTTAEFDALDSLEIMGGSASLRSLAAREGVHEDIIGRRFWKFVHAGIITSAMVELTEVPLTDEVLTNRLSVYTMTPAGRDAFNHALWLMDHGRAAA
ncbi:MAG: hypothetical protein JWM98_1800 [Thermoleophilia bacterium]|nr:hypothetical protein [Thermoleophilia bacterium]